MAGANTGKPRQIKAWPDLTGLAPLLKAQDKIIKSKSSRLHLDLSHVYSIDAIGLAIFLARLSQLKSTSPNATSLISHPESRQARSHLFDLKFETRLSELGFDLPSHRGLFDEIENTNETKINFENSTSINKEETITIIPNPDIHREILLSNAKRSIKDFLKIDQKRLFAHEQLMIILLEMVKNTLDHSNRPAIIGLKLRQPDESHGSLSFCYCDTGDGIGKSIRKYIQDQLGNSPEKINHTFSEDRAQVIRLMQKGGFSDILHWALQPGNSTKSGNGINLGLGLMLIVEGARNCGLRLSLKDADSMWLLTALHAPYSHAEIRRLATNTCADPLLVYHGEMEFCHEH